jgi:hypothetical protein
MIRKALVKPGGVLVLGMVMSGCNIMERSQPPKVNLAGVRHTEKHFRASDLMIRFSPAPEKAGAPTTVLQISEGNVEGFIRIRRVQNPKDWEPLPQAPNAGAHVLARKEAKQYSWGSGRSCLAQFTNEAGGSGPNNEELTYQVSAMTSDHRYSVFGSFRIGHPRLRSPRFYHVKDWDELASDPGLRIIERAAPDEFRPTMSQLDEVIESVTIEK